MEPIGEVAPDEILQLLDPDEPIALSLETHDAKLRVTDRRLIVTSEDRVRLAIIYEDLRRIEFDLEYARPAVLVVVPQRVSDPPQILAIERPELHCAAEILAFVGQRLP